jgi:hypothetical protein
VTTLKLERISAIGNPCYEAALCPLKVPPEPPSFLNLLAFKTRDYIVLGGDWSVLQDLPSHLQEKVMGMPAYEKKTCILRFQVKRKFPFIGAKMFLVEIPDKMPGLPRKPWYKMQDVE